MSFSAEKFAEQYLLNFLIWDKYNALNELHMISYSLLAMLLMILAQT